MRSLRLLLCFSMAAAAPGCMAPEAARSHSPQTNEAVSTVDQRKQALERFMAQRKFQPNGLYRPPSEAKRLLFESRVNALAARLRARSDSATTKADVLGEFQSTLKEFDLEDGDDKDEMLRHVEEIMAIFGIQSSDGLLNKWRYGFDPSQSLEARNADARAQMTDDERVLLARLEAVQKESALASLTQLLGTPSSGPADMHIWFLGKDRADAIILGTDLQSGAQLIMWQGAGRFSYARKL